jgi:hypothetical protein
MIPPAFGCFLNNKIAPAINGDIKKQKSKMAIMKRGIKAVSQSRGVRRGLDERFSGHVQPFCRSRIKN